MSDLTARWGIGRRRSTPADFAACLHLHTPAEELHALLRPYAAEEMTAVPGGRHVSNPRNEGPQCLAS
jgi:hypothetical protein